MKSVSPFRYIVTLILILLLAFCCGVAGYIAGRPAKDRTVEITISDSTTDFRITNAATGDTVGGFGFPATEGRFTVELKRASSR